jgi:Transposase DDE domain
VLLTDERGLPLGYTIVPANEKEYEPLADLLTGTPAEVVIADKGLWGRAYRERLAAGGTVLLTPDKTRTAANIGRERALASSRLVIESVFANRRRSTVRPAAAEIEIHRQGQRDQPSGAAPISRLGPRLLRTFTARPGRRLRRSVLMPEGEPWHSRSASSMHRRSSPGTVYHVSPRHLHARREPQQSRDPARDAHSCRRAMTASCGSLVASKPDVRSADGAAVRRRG